ncbi:MAG: trypsin-like peptidase domain-containing protein [Pseudonocardiaceae bacterium]
MKRATAKGAMTAVQIPVGGAARRTRRRRLAVLNALVAFVVGSAALAGCDSQAIIGAAGPLTIPAPPDTASTLTPSTTPNLPAVVLPAIAPPADALPELPQLDPTPTPPIRAADSPQGGPSDPGPTCGKNQRRNADGDCVPRPTPTSAPSPTSPTPSPPVSGEESADLSALAASVSPALVDIHVRLNEDAAAAGTGIVLSSSGQVLTNNHVVDGATSIRVTNVGNGRAYPATVVGYHRSRDIAVLQLQGATGLQAAAIGDSSRVAVGDDIGAIGIAGGRDDTPSIAGGKVVALDQTITVRDEQTGNGQRLTGLIQVSAQLQPGYSGGPLVNTAGQVIGVNTAAATRSPSQTSDGEGFAIPINDAIAISEQITAAERQTATAELSVVDPAAVPTG